MLAIWSLGPLPFSKFSFHIWKFSVHVLLKPSLQDLENDLASMKNECNCAVVWAFFGTGLLWYWNENWPFSVCGHCSVFQICQHTECSTLTASFCLSLACFQHFQAAVLEQGLPRWCHRTRKGQFSFQYQRKAMPKNVQTIAKLHSFCTLAS